MFWQIFILLLETSETFCDSVVKELNLGAFCTLKLHSIFVRKKSPSDRKNARDSYISSSIGKGYKNKVLHIDLPGIKFGRFGRVMAV